MFNIIHQIVAFGQIANEKSDFVLNSGGCAVYASILCKYLKKHKIDAVGRVVMYEASGFEDLTIDRPNSAPTMKQWNDNGIHFNHIVVSFALDDMNYLVDCDAMDTIDRSRNITDVNSFGPLLKGSITPGDIRILADRTRGWNELFDRSIIPELKRIAPHYLLKPSTSTV